MYYIGRIPSEAMIGARNMMPDKHKELHEWHQQQLLITDWNFEGELIKYCRADVELLSKGIPSFREMYITKLDTDPFRYTTLATLCMNNYMHKFMPKDTSVGNSNFKHDSVVCREWLNYLNNENIKREVPIHAHNLSLIHI